MYIIDEKNGERIEGHNGSFIFGHCNVDSFRLNSFFWITYRFIWIKFIAYSFNSAAYENFNVALKRAVCRTTSRVGSRMRETPFVLKTSVDRLKMKGKVELEHGTP